jgi:excisionase family DNA binding protein
MQDQDERRVQASARTPGPDPQTWTYTEAAPRRGFSRATAYEAAHRGELPARLIGRRMLVPRSALLRLLEQDAPLNSRPI